MIISSDGVVIEMSSSKQKVVSSLPKTAKRATIGSLKKTLNLQLLNSKLQLDFASLVSHVG